MPQYSNEIQNKRYFRIQGLSFFLSFALLEQLMTYLWLLANTKEEKFAPRDTFSYASSSGFWVYMDYIVLAYSDKC